MSLGIVNKRWGLLSLFLVVNNTVAGTTTDTFKVSAVVTSGCALGARLGATNTNFGTLNFGKIADISANIDIASTAGAGSIIVTCTPGTAITLSLDYGVNGGNATTRYLSNGSKLLGYQLYQDASHNTVWGSGSQAYSVGSFPNSTQTYTVYGRLFSSNTLPTPGTYTDVVTVTLAY